MENKRYFCEECGSRFIAPPPKASTIFRPSVECPRCGCFCTYEDNDKGRRESVRDYIDYENEIEF